VAAYIAPAALAAIVVLCLRVTTWGARQFSYQATLFATFSRYDPRSLFVRGPHRITSSKES